MIKSTDASEDDEDHRSVKAIELMRNNQYNGRRECGDGQLGNRKDDQYGWKKYNLRSSGHTNHDVELQAVNATEAESNPHLQFSIIIIMI